MVRVTEKPRAVEYNGYWHVFQKGSFTRKGWTLPEAYAAWCHRNHQRYTLT